ncbi:cupin domain-containing protein [Methylophaga sp. OBS4]|uniref:cupin domain-containing protein n=1 Tax=Methylophaga sp. OBS4 TaxID=2991935 RepID=UPI002253ECDD|nr:cupin domain-containing protein [Methylophaga sp. OBS4]MCX4187291.1 cupin domain-containing protein [Methylophaga sp. OBS4]
MPKTFYHWRMSAQIKRFDPDKEYFFVEGCFINELSNSSQDPDVSIARARVTPGVTTHWHRLSATTERYVILEGQGEIEMGDNTPEPLGAGDVVIIPPQTRQRITNTGQEDLIFLAICSPRFHDKNYIDS